VIIPPQRKSTAVFIPPSAIPLLFKHMTKAIPSGYHIHSPAGLKYFGAADESFRCPVETKPNLA
jgi:hypothetical protein